MDAIAKQERRHEVCEPHPIPTERASRVLAVGRGARPADTEGNYVLYSGYYRAEPTVRSSASDPLVTGGKAPAF